MSLEKNSLLFLKNMLNISSPSGHEKEIAEIYKYYLKQFCDNTYIDIIGNSIGVLHEKAQFKIMLAGHLDEIGYKVVYISKEGNIYFRCIGGINIYTVPGTKVMVFGINGSLVGVIGQKAVHLTKEKDKNSMFDISSMWIDVGAKSKSEIEKIVCIGDPVTVLPNQELLLSNRMVSKGLDDKIGAFIIAEATRLISKSNISINTGIYCVGTAQEEVGIRGAKTACFDIEPSLGIVVDVGFATDTPDIKICEMGDMKLGGGPIIYRSADQDDDFVCTVIKIAKQNQINIQVNGMNMVGKTDAGSMRVSKKGTKIISLGIPLRYMHTPVELVDMNDVESSINLIVAIVKYFSV